MRTTIDSAGRVVIPKEILRGLQLSGGFEVEITERDGVIEIQPAPMAMTLKRDRTGVSAVPKKPLPPLTDEMVRETIERTRR